MASIARVSILEEASDITHVFSSLSSKLLRVFSIDPSMWATRKQIGVKGNFNIWPISVFGCTTRNKMLPN